MVRRDKESVPFQPRAVGKEVNCNERALASQAFVSGSSTVDAENNIDKYDVVDLKVLHSHPTNTTDVC